MEALTADRPKPLLQLGEKTLIDYQLDRLQAAGFEEVVVNVSYRGDMIKEALRNRSQPELTFSEEPEALETAGGIVQALHLLSEPFLLISADVVTDVNLTRCSLPEGSLASLIMVPNPTHHPDGDFGIQHGRVTRSPPKFTYSGVGCFSKRLFEGLAPGYRPLREVLNPAIEAGQLAGTVYEGVWFDVGTPERLLRARQQLADQ